MVDDEQNGAESSEEAQDDVLTDVRPDLPALVPIAGAALAIAALLPLFPDGRSFASVIAEIASGSPMDALFMTLGLGAPFLFGAILAATPLLIRAGHAGVGITKFLITTNLAIFHAQLFLIALFLVRSHSGIGTLGLMGFSVVSGLYFIIDSARSAAMDEAFGTRRLASLARWGATMVYAVAVWTRLQWFAGVRFGLAIEVALLAAVIIAVRLRPRPGA